MVRRAVMCLRRIAQSNIPKACYDAHLAKKSGSYSSMFKNDFRRHLKIRIALDGLFAPQSMPKIRFLQARAL